MKEIFLTAIEYLDRFSTKFNYKINGKRKYNTLISVVCSLIINFICSFYFLGLIIEMINHKNQIVTYTNLKTDNIINKTYNSKDLVFSIDLIEKNNNILIDPTVLTIVPTYEIIKNINGELIDSVYNLDLENCSIIYPFYEMYNLENIYKNKNIKYSFCFNSKETNITLGGNYGSHFYGKLAVYIKKCVNSTKNNKYCKPKEFIDSIIRGLRLQINFISSYIDINNYHEPIKYSALNFNYLLDPDMNKIVNEYISPIYFYSHDKFIFGETMKYDSTFVESSLSDINFIEKNKDIISTIYISQSFKKYEYYRKYTKIYEVFSLFGGFCYFFHSLFHFLTSIYNNQELDFYMSNSLFVFTENEKELRNKTIKTFLINLNNKPKIGKFISSKKITKSIMIHKNSKNIFSSSKSNKPNKINEFICGKKYNTNTNYSDSNIKFNKTKDFSCVFNAFNNQLIKIEKNKNKYISNKSLISDSQWIKAQKKVNNASNKSLCRINYLRLFSQRNKRNNYGFNLKVNDFNASHYKKFPLISSNKEIRNMNNDKKCDCYKLKFDFIYILQLFFCPCLKDTKNLSREYIFIYNELKYYCDFIEVTKLLMEIESKQKTLFNYFSSKNICLNN